MDIPFIQLNDGQRIPQLGLGTWKTADADAADLVLTALRLGYRHIDTAAIYGNERGIGEGLARAGVPRGELYITTKLWNDRQGYDETLKAFDESLQRLGLDYVDLYLIHWPCPERNRFLDSWKAMLRLREEGRIQSVGVSNFREEEIEAVIMETGVVPAVNQIEVHPWLQQRALRELGTYKGIATEAWSPLAQGGELLADPVVRDLAAKHGKTPAQVILRWHVQQGSIIFPKSSNPARIEENAAIFDFQLDEADLQRIAGLERGQRLGPDPATFNG